MLNHSFYNLTEYNRLLKQILPLFGFCLIPFISIGQNLAGKWKGYYFDESEKRSANKKLFLTLEFIKSEDSSYNVFSYSKLSGFEAQCRMSVRLGKTDSVFLEEVELMNPGRKESTCFQRMKLRIIIVDGGTNLSLEGYWDSVVEECGYGKIYFLKQK